MMIDPSSLSPNVRRWLDRSVAGDGSIPNQILNTQRGEMNIRGKWTPFKAETFNQARPFTFVWKARFNVIPGVWLVAEDGHDGQSGWGGAKLWGIIPMGGRKGPEVFAMQLVRNLAELPWQPQFALALPNLGWRDTSDTAFEVRTAAGNQDIAVCFELNQDDEIVRASSKRYYDVPNGFVEAPWHYDFSDHQDYDNLHIPASAAATYVKPDGAQVYWRAKITSVTQRVP